MYKQLILSACLAMSMLGAAHAGDPAINVPPSVNTPVPGDVEGMLSLGKSLFYGDPARGLQANKADAAEWFRKAAARGNTQAQVILGSMYADGLGVTQSHDEAFKWYQKAADKGFDKGQLLLGHAYYLGQGVEQNFVEAAKWYAMAANQGNSEALYFLGTIYEQKDKAEGLKYYEQACKNGFNTACKHLA